MEARARTRTVLALTSTASWIILAGTELYTQTMGFVVPTVPRHLLVLSIDRLCYYKLKTTVSGNIYYLVQT